VSHQPGPARSKYHRVGILPGLRIAGRSEV
jgi:hypothetical protein